MQGQPILQAGFVAHEQGLEAGEPGVESLNNEPSAIQLRVQRRVVIGLPVGLTPVAQNISFDVAPGTGLAQPRDIERFIRIKKQAF